METKSWSSPTRRRGRPSIASKIRKRFVAALDRASLRRVRFHDLRHTFGTHCAASGVPLRALQEWMGHKDAKTTEIYADYAPSPHEAELVERAFAVQSGAPAGWRSSLGRGDP